MVAAGFICAGAPLIFWLPNYGIRAAEVEPSPQVEPRPAPKPTPDLVAPAPETEKKQPASELQEKKPAEESLRKFEKTDLTRAGCYLRLPDGTSVPILNEAYGAPPMLWPRELPWSPIVSKYVDPEGYEWYLHKDGTHSTTQMVHNSQNRRQEPITSVFNPEKPLPIHDPDDLAEQENRKMPEKAGKDEKKQATQGKGEAGKPPAKIE